MIPGRVIPFSQQSDRCQTSARTLLSIVQVSGDRELSRLREKVLVSAGHSVLSIRPDELAAASTVSREPRVWIFCHTIEFYELASMAVTVRRMRPADKLLLLTGLNDTGQVPIAFDGRLDPVAGLTGLLQTVEDFVCCVAG